MTTRNTSAAIADRLTDEAEAALDHAAAVENRRHRLAAEAESARARLQAARERHEKAVRELRPVAREEADAAVELAAARRECEKAERAAREAQPAPGSTLPPAVAHLSRETIATMDAYYFDLRREADAICAKNAPTAADRARVVALRAAMGAAHDLPRCDDPAAEVMRRRAALSL